MVLRENAMSSEANSKGRGKMWRKAFKWIAIQVKHILMKEKK